MECLATTEEPHPADRLVHHLDGNRLTISGNGPELRDMLVDLIDGAQHSLRLYYYIFANDGSGRLVLAHLIRAARRGVDVTLMVDAFGSGELPSGFFAGLERAGGRVGWFGSSWSTRYLIRNHQKMALADDSRAMIGGFNIADPYFGIPEDDCWHDLGLLIEGPEAQMLGQWYQWLWNWVSAPHRRFRRLGAMVRGWKDRRDRFRWLVGGPARRLSPWARTVREDLDKGRQVDMIAAYFAPGNGLLARLRRVAERGRLRLVFPSRSDNAATVAAARLLYGPLLRRGAEIYEYLPCRLHMKLIVIDDIVYIGSANFDMRSLFLNLEIMLRIKDAELAAKVRLFVDARIADSDRIDEARHRAGQTPLTLIKRWISYFLVGILDYKITRRLNFPE
ncbi:MAG: phosphatidylserine/phosphatidylglycerophosphate/cardiolipin synthase family protein [Sphingobium sp.]